MKPARREAAVPAPGARGARGAPRCTDRPVGSSNTPGSPGCTAARWPPRAAAYLPARQRRGFLRQPLADAARVLARHQPVADGRADRTGRYLAECLRRGYWNNRFEIEAREFADRARRRACTRACRSCAPLSRAAPRAGRAARRAPRSSSAPRDERRRRPRAPHTPRQRLVAQQARDQEVLTERGHRHQRERAAQAQTPREHQRQRRHQQHDVPARSAPRGRCGCRRRRWS